MIVFNRQPKGSLPVVITTKWRQDPLGGKALIDEQYMVGPGQGIDLSILSLEPECDIRRDQAGPFPPGIYRFGWSGSAGRQYLWVHPIKEEDIGDTLNWFKCNGQAMFYLIGTSEENITVFPAE